MSTEQNKTNSINQNLGKFTTKKATQPHKEIENKTTEKNEVVNFDKFSKTKKRKFSLIKFRKQKEYRPKSKLGIKIEQALQNNKLLSLVWLFNILIFAILIAMQTFYVIEINNFFKADVGPIKLSVYKNLAITTTVFSYISIFLPVPIYIFLVGSWFVGINGVYRSRFFHSILWGTYLISILFFVLATIFGFIVMGNQWAFHPYTLNLI